MPDQVIWGIHIRTDAGNKLFVERGFIAVGWPEIGDLSQIAPDREAFKAVISTKSPEKSPGYVAGSAGQLYRFSKEMKPGDWIVYRATYFDGLVHIGQITGEYRYEPSWLSDYPNVRQVKWLKALPPMRFTQGALYELGAAMTLFQLNKYGEEYLAALEGNTPDPVAEDDETVAFVAGDIEQNTEDFILKELQHQLKGHGFQGFIADLLRTMGYRITESKPGPDEGIDILAHRDELRLLPPIVKVQVKSGDGNVSRDTVQALTGNLGHGEYGLLVTVSGFTNQARDFARTKNNIRLMDGSALVELVLEHYEELQPRYKALIPLKRVYVPQASSASAE